MGIKIWLDDIRPIPEGYDIWAKDQPEAEFLIVFGTVEKISFDHDLGDFHGTGYGVAKTIELWANEGKIPPIKWEIHSANPVGRRNIEMAMKSAERFWKQNGFDID